MEIWDVVWESESVPVLGRVSENTKRDQNGKGGENGTVA